MRTPVCPGLSEGIAEMMLVDAVRLRMLFVGRAMCVVFALAWVMWFAPWDDLLDRNGTPLGADYSMFYTAGRVVLEGSGRQLYDQALHQRRLHELFPGMNAQACLPYRYPPFVALLMAPCSALPYAASFACFTSMSIAALCTATFLWTKRLGLTCGSWLWCVAGWPVVWETLMGGQASAFGLLILSGGLLLLARGKETWAGVVLGLAAYKPNLLLLVILGCAIRYPRLLRGLLPTVAACAIVSCFSGANVVGEYARAILGWTTESWDVAPPIWKLQSLAAWAAMYPQFPARGLLLAAGAVIAIAIGVAWRCSDEKGESLAFYPAIALLVCVNAAFNPYTPIYDLLLLSVAVFAMVGGAARFQVGDARVVSAGLALLYFGPHLSQRLAESIGFQLFPLVLAAWIVWLGAVFVGVCTRCRGGLITPRVAGLECP